MAKQTIASKVEHRHRAVVFHSLGRQHGHRTLASHNVASRLADVLALPFEPGLDPTRWSPGECYVVPDDTLLSSEATALGIHRESDLFGGVVPYPFVATKCVSHGLIGPEASRPAGWVDSLATRLEGMVLPGYSAFSLDDAREAARRLIDRYGPIRIKAAAATGGSGQSVHADIAGAEASLGDLPADSVSTSGLVIETNLDEEATWSVGTVRIGAMAAAYYGTQRTTPDNEGRAVYGGSTLYVVRGGWDELLAAPMPAAAREAAQRARRYHDAMFAAYPAMMASRCNYDIMTGRDANGRRQSAVLEQSWRIGGASGAECAALLVLRDDSSRDMVEVSTHEVYGPGAVPPPGAQILFQGDDPDVGPILKYVDLER